VKPISTSLCPSDFRKIGDEADGELDIGEHSNEASVGYNDEQAVELPMEPTNGHGR